MSAYVVSIDTIDLLTSAARYWNTCTYAYGNQVRNGGHDYLHGRTDYEAIGQLLLDENVHSVNVRYHEQNQAPRYRHQWVDLDSAAFEAGCDVSVLVLASIRCLRYQTCEAPDYRDSRAARVLDDIENDAIRHLPGMDDAPYGWTRDRIKPDATPAENATGVES